MAEFRSAWMDWQPDSQDEVCTSNRNASQRSEGKTSSQSEAAQAIASLQEKGYVVIRSETLGCNVVWSVDRRHAPSSTDYVVYTLDELTKLVEGNVTPESLRIIHAAKSLFEGHVTPME